MFKDLELQNFAHGLFLLTNYAADNGLDIILYSDSFGMTVSVNTEYLTSKDRETILGLGFTNRKFNFQGFDFNAE